MNRAATVSDYIAGFPRPVQRILQQIRKTIRKAAPAAEEVISYGIAGYRYQGMLVFFAGFEHHVSIYPAPRQAPAFKKELAGYPGGKGTVQFSLDKPVDLDLIDRITRFRLAENEKKAAASKLVKAKAKKPAKKAVLKK